MPSSNLTNSSSGPKLCYHASHEQFSPSELITWVQRAEKAGFNGFFSSDHFHPWSEAQGQAGFSWSWMGAAFQATSIPGAMICCPGYRYHPAVVAQAAATLAEMNEGRYWLAIGSGEAINERMTGLPWPAKDLRNARLRECADVIRALWKGEMVTHRGLVHVEEAKLYTLPKTTPLLIGAAIGEKTAEWLGGWADGLLTTSRPRDELKKMVEAFHRGGGEGKPLFLKSGLSYAVTKEKARLQAHQQWRSVAFAPDLLAELRTPGEFDAAGKHVRPEDMDEMIRISDSLEEHAAWIQDDLDAGFTQVVLHNIGTNQDEFIDTFGSKVLPQFL
ncbi:TIGR03885 family FMN-dependent LLM class oxidoreductase [Prosthecobacter sp. SYSU 5D2]|uniref:TIGR03885 family FMN-dependent LLM class oxidoreductase n=1 Tax=Prosthecobacter sp. SYSU 5D2 TaxID=3134134 RepID=UPI0031FEB34C